MSVLWYYFVQEFFYFLRAFFFATDGFSSHKTKPLFFQKKIIKKMEELRYKVHSLILFLLSSFLSEISCSIGFWLIPCWGIDLWRYWFVKFSVSVSQRTRRTVNKIGNFNYDYVKITLTCTLISTLLNIIYTSLHMPNIVLRFVWCRPKITVLRLGLELGHITLLSSNLRI